jgi:hypothetical protein
MDFKNINIDQRFGAGIIGTGTGNGSNLFAESVSGPYQGPRTKYLQLKKYSKKAGCF